MSAAQQPQQPEDQPDPAACGAGPIDARRFVSRVTPLLESQDLPALVAALRGSWTDGQIVSLLSCGHCDARKCAALALSLVGGPSCLDPLARRLADADPVVNEMAEHAMWSIWFRGGSPEACRLLVRGTEAMNARDLDAAVEKFTRAVALSPDFAEAYNQRAIAHYLAEEFLRSAADCRRAVDLMPCHFGAWAGLGHCLAHLGKPAEAVRCYGRALEINPHLDCLRDLCAELE